MRTDERGDATFGGLLVAVAVVIFGLAVNAATWLIGQVETNTGGTAGVVISGTAVTASVGGIVYIARKMISGELVARAQWCRLGQHFGERPELIGVASRGVLIRHRSSSSAAASAANSSSGELATSRVRL